MSKQRKSPGHKPPGDRKQKSNGKRSVKEKTVAAEVGAATMREEAPKPTPAPVLRPARPVVAKPVEKEMAPEPSPVLRPARPVVAKQVEKDKAPKPVPASPPMRSVKEAEAEKAPEAVSPPARPEAVKQAETEKAPEPPPVLRSTSPVVEKEPEKKKPLGPASSLLTSPLDTFERSFKAAGQNAVAVNQKLLDFARANVTSTLDFAVSLATASSPMQMMQLQMSYWDERVKALVSQAEELRALSADLMAKTSEPIRHVWVKRSGAV